MAYTYTGTLSATATDEENGVNAQSSQLSTIVAGYYGSTGGRAVLSALNSSSGSGGYAVSAIADGANAFGVYGEATAETGFGVYGKSPFVGVYAYCTANSGYGVYANAVGTGAAAVYAVAPGGGSYGVKGSGYGGLHGSGRTGVYGVSTQGGGFGVFGHQGSGTYAGYFHGDVDVNGHFSKGTGSFLIDHPLDPSNKLLEHSFVESPERKNVYDGVGTADSAGEITVQMPVYFEALNRDFRYQLTAIGEPAPGLHVKQEINKAQFVIAGAIAGQRVSWQVTGNRKDALSEARPLVVERDKPHDERGLYLHPEAFGQPKEKGVATKRNPPAPELPQVRPTPP